MAHFWHRDEKNEPPPVTQTLLRTVLELVLSRKITTMYLVLLPVCTLYDD